MAYRRKHPEIVDQSASAEFCAQHTKEELYDEGQKRRIAVTPINTAGEFIEMEQTKARGLFVDMEHPVIGKYKQFGPLCRGSSGNARQHLSTRAAARRAQQGNLSWTSWA